MHYSVQPRDRIFVKRLWFLSFAKTMGKDNGIILSKKWSGKNSEKLLDHAKQSATDAFKTASKRANQKTPEATGDLIGNKIANRITKVSKNSQQNNSEAVTNRHDKEIPKGRYTSPEKKARNYWNNRISKNHESFKKFTTKQSRDSYEWEWWRNT